MMTEDSVLLRMAIRGAQASIKEWERELGGEPGKMVHPQESAGPKKKKKHHLSEAGRLAISRAAKKRWATTKKKAKKAA